jgi:hypothetical protein
LRKIGQHLALNICATPRTLELLLTGRDLTKSAKTYERVLPTPVLEIMKRLSKIRTFVAVPFGIGVELFPKVVWFKPSAPKTMAFPEMRTTNAVPKQSGQQQRRITVTTARTRV